MTPSTEGEEEEAAAAQQRCGEEAGQIACETTPSCRAAVGGGCRVSEGRLKRRSGFLEAPGAAFFFFCKKFSDILLFLRVLAGREGAPARLLASHVARVPVPEPGRLPVPSEPGCRRQLWGPAFCRPLPDGGKFVKGSRHSCPNGGFKSKSSSRF